MTEDGAFALRAPVDYRRLGNGLRVVVSADASAPIVAVAVYYEVGFRLEPRGRTGFAHLFEHLMFQGSGQLGKMELVRLVQQNGGMLNGSTRTDYTNYFEVLPKQALELALWLEADRMRGPRITRAELDNQRDVVKNEVRVNVLNRPYGGFPWIDMSERAFSNWHNAHNGYGEFGDLDAASLEDAQRFFGEYYSPRNAVLAIVGDVEAEQAFALAERHFGAIVGAPPPPPPDIGEPRQEAERTFTKADPLAPRPALAFAYQTPPRESPQFLAMGLLHQLLAAGDDSLLHRELVSRRGYGGELGAGINFLGNMYTARTPLLWTCSLIHDAAASPEAIVEAAEETIAPLRESPPDGEAFARALVKARSGLYAAAGGGVYPAIGRADLLASFALFDDDPERLNRIEAETRAVTPQLVLETAREYLRPERRTVLAVEPGAGAA